jgi:hypothetical protein
VAGVVALITGALLLAGCGGGGVQVDRFDLDAEDRAACSEFLEQLPEQVADRNRRDVEGSKYAAAWGDPAIVLRCGVPLPDDFAIDPCITRDDIGWSIPAQQTEDQATDVVMTVAHRTPVVQVRVPADYRPNGAMSVMADLAAVVREHTTATGSCT